MQLRPPFDQLLRGLPGDASLADLRAAAARPYVPEGPLVRSRELAIPGPGGELRARIYEPPQSSGLNAGLLFFGAGAWVVPDVYGHGALCQQLAISAACVVVAVEPRAAPEHKFPAAVLDAYAAACWVHENADDFGIDHQRLAIGGESSGATLATAVCRLAKERRNPPLAFQLLLYPITDVRQAALEQVEASQLTAAPIDAGLLAKLVACYVANDADREDPRCSPLVAKNLIGVPPALIIAAEHDALNPQIDAYADALRAAHVPVTLSRYAGMTHGFVHAFALLDRGRDAVVECSAALRTAFAKQSDG